MDGGAADLLKAGLNFGRDEFFSDMPALKSKLQPHNLVDCGDGIMQMSLGFQFPMGDGTYGVMDKGVLFFDTTPGQSDMTVAWARRS